MAHILALDTSAQACSVALYKAGEVISGFEMTPREHTQRLMPMIRNLMAEAALALSQLDAIAFGAGPGSFTGLRITAGVAQGLAFGLGVPVIPVSTLEALALQVAMDPRWSSRADIEPQSLQILALLDARMSEVYAAAYTAKTSEANNTPELHPLMNECVASVESVLSSPQMQALKTDSELVVVGDGWLVDEESWAKEVSVQEKNLMPDLTPRAEEMVQIAYRKWCKGQTVHAEQCSPIYLRDEVTWKKLPGRE